ncbi:hypothetical protein RYH73_14840 [Olivibacter sp. CPCC 100613]|uniref:hypothetical protein n=1 Tax=Olivibacter sp. CPCC 100613 TaxID=3079931 RepID=UPI002FFC9067
MYKFRINFKEGIEENYRLIAIDYWKIEESRFVHTIVEIAQKYGVSHMALTGIVQRNATCSKFVGVCSICQEEIWQTASNRTSFNSLKKKSQCEECRELERQKWLDQVEARNRGLRQRETKQQLQQKGLNQIPPSTTLKFSLARNTNKTKPKQPEYSGTFVLKQDVVIKAGVKYLYGGWELTDGSINLQFKPVEEIFPTQQRDIREEPGFIGRQVEQLYNDLMTINEERDKNDEPPF